MVQSYEGRIGKFQYDDKSFCISGDGYLKYIGNETDGKNIHVPEGLVDGTGLFESVELTSGASLPGTLRVMDRMYFGCSHMTDPGSIPDGVTDINGAYAYTGITETPHMPDGIVNANFAFDHCTDLESCGQLPVALKEANCMFSGNTQLTRLPAELPEGLVTMDGFACDCINLKIPPVTGDNVKNMDHAYASCVSLEEQPYIPEGASAENVVADCYTLEHPDEEPEHDPVKKQERAMDREAAADAMLASIEKQDGKEQDFQK